MRVTTRAALLILLGCTNAWANPVHVESAEGEVVIRNVGLHHVIVLVDSAARTTDGRIDQWFVLESEAALSPISILLRRANLVFSPGSLRVVSAPDKTIYDFIVSERAESKPVPTAFQLIRYEGFGLSHVVHETTIDIGSRCAEGDACLPVLDWDESGGNGGTVTCDGGGPGSNSCSVTASSSACAVTCNPGFYACCKAVAGLPTCKCVKS